MEKTYKTESRQIKRIALNARLTFNYRNIILSYQNYVIAICLMLLAALITDVLVKHDYYIFSWIGICIISIPMYILLTFVFSMIPRYETLDLQIEGAIKKYLKDHSWRNIYLLMKKHKFPIVITNALENIFYKKVSIISNQKKIIKIIEKDDIFKFDRDNKKIIKIKK